jgi:hypothetical protein
MARPAVAYEADDLQTQAVRAIRRANLDRLTYRCVDQLAVCLLTAAHVENDHPDSHQLLLRRSVCYARS